MWGFKVVSDYGIGFSDWQLSAYDAVASIVSSGALNNTPAIITASVGGTCRSGNATYCRHDTPFARAIEDLGELGVPVVVAAGNDGDDACFYNPGAARTAINVGASDINDRVVGYSNWGACVDIMAPGDYVPSATSSFIANANLDFVDDTVHEYWLQRGTSMSAPAVAGILAQYVEALGLVDTAGPAVDAMLHGATDNALSGARGCQTNSKLPRSPNDSDHVPVVNQSYIEPTCALPDERPHMYFDDDDYYQTINDDENTTLTDDVEVNLHNISETGWCQSDLDEVVNHAYSPMECWERCSEKYGESIVAVDFYEPFFCFCQTTCNCMYAGTEGTLVVLADYTLPAECPINCVMDCGSCMELITNQCGQDCSEEYRAEFLSEYCGVTVPAPYPQPEPTPAPAPTVLHSNDTCYDRPGWHKVDSPELDCSWVAQNLPNRCAVKGNFGWAYESCPVACSTCPDRSCEGDSTSWQLPEGGCDVVAESRQSYCPKKNSAGEYAFEACPQACHLCTLSNCTDDDTWMLNEDRYGRKDCAWVADAAVLRCRKVSQDTGVGAYRACPFACGLCDVECKDSPHWLREEGNNEKDCSWVAEVPELRCSLEGVGSVWAYEACASTCLC